MQIGFGAVGAVIGAVLGVLLLISLPKKNAAGRGFGLVLLAGLVLVGGSLGAMVMEPFFGPRMRAERATDAGRQIDALFREQPLFVAIAEIDPEAAQRMRSEVEAAYLEGGPDAAARRSAELGEVLGRQAVSQYAPRASDGALLGFYQAILAWGRSLQDEPAACYSAMYRDIAAEVPMSPAEVAATAPPGAMDRMQAAMAGIIVSAGRETANYDREAALAAQEEAGEQLLEVRDPGDLRFLTGIAPESAAEMQLACDVMLSTMEIVLAHPEAAAIFRLWLTPAD